jgi:uracil phosphoribosyltransferase
MLHNLSENNSLLNHFVAELRDITIQGDSQRFRNNLKRIGEVLAYELSKELEYRPQTITTPLATCETKLLVHPPVIAAVLRAGLPLADGLSSYFDRSEYAFISAYRKHSSETEFEIQLDYLACCNLNERTLIIADPMLATGASLVKTIDELLKLWTPKEIHVCAAIAAQAGIDHLHTHHPSVNIWTAAVDAELNNKKYIVPGLGDAGDLAFGVKVQG